MPEGLITPGGTPVELPDIEAGEAAFHGAMAAPPADAPTHPGPPKRDPDAPYGYKADGTARKRSAGPGRPKADAPRVTTSPPPSAPKSSETADQAAERRATGVLGLFQLGAAGMALAYNSTKQDAFLADAVALGQHAPAIATACAEVASTDERFARVIDKITNAGPYAALIGAIVPLVTQLARNHGVKAMGAVSPESLIATLDQPGESGE